jgi:nicotinamide phosphoribosyltransferase
MNILLKTDSYKYSHYKQYPPGAEYVSSYIEARGSDDPDFDFVMTVGIQAFIQKYLLTPFTQEDIWDTRRTI